MSFKREYVPFGASILFSLGGLFLLSQFIISGIFSVRTIILLSGGSLSFIALTVSTHPRFKKWFVQRMRFKNSVYWAMNIIFLVIALVLFSLGIGVGGTEYTNYMEQMR